jgi:hypothetical protein
VGELEGEQHSGAKKLKNNEETNIPRKSVQKNKDKKEKRK